MMILFLIITAALTLYAAFNIIAPFFQSREDQLRFEVLDEDLRAIEELVARRSYLLKSLRELQLDHETGKLPDEDYEQTRRSLELEAVEVLRELDDIHGGRGWQDAIDAELDERLDGIRRRADDDDLRPTADESPAATSTDAPDDTDDHDLIECPECGKELEPEARFCSRCGHAFNSDADELDDDGEAGNVSGPADAPNEPASVDEMLSEPKNADVSETSAEVAR